MRSQEILKKPKKPKIYRKCGSPVSCAERQCLGPAPRGDSPNATDLKKSLYKRLYNDLRKLSKLSQTIYHGLTKSGNPDKLHRRVLLGVAVTHPPVWL